MKGDKYSSGAMDKGLARTDMHPIVGVVHLRIVTENQI